jgi:ketosteroid isomerase-like protein
MSRENVELVKHLSPTGVDLVELFVTDQEGDEPLVSGSSDTFADDFQVRFISGEPGWDMEHRGAEGLIAGWREWLEPWESYRMDTEELLDAGDEVVTLIRVRARTARDGVVVEHSPAAVWSISEGKVVAIRFYLEREQAMKAAGLRQQDVQR